MLGVRLNHCRLPLHCLRGVLAAQAALCGVFSRNWSQAMAAGPLFLSNIHLVKSTEALRWDWIAWQRRWNTAKLSFPRNDKRTRPSVLLKFLTQLCGKHAFFVAHHPCLLTSEDKVTSTHANYTMWGNIVMLSGTEWQGLNNSETSFLSLVTL